jgi:hypothetical protein
MTSRGNKKGKMFGFLTSVAALPLFFVLSVFPQETPVGAEVAPPPLKLLAKTEAAQLHGETDVKKRTRIALEFMEGRLAESERLGSDGKFDEMYSQLGCFHAIMDDTLQFLVKHDTDSGKILNNLKKFEIGLRSFVPRLEIVRAQLPPNYEPYVRALVIYIGDAREKAIAPFFGTTVVPGEKN